MPTPGGLVVFVDANVWFSRTLRDWIGVLYTVPDTPIFQVRWTEDVLAELLYHLRRRHPDWDGVRISSIRDRLAATFEVGRVVDFPGDAGYQGKDPLDAHIHAATLACGADILLTYNTADFVWDMNMSPYEVMHPDPFLALVDDSAPHLVSAATLQMCRYWLRISDEADLPHHLKKAGCPEFAERVRLHLQAQSDALVQITKGLG